MLSERENPKRLGFLPNSAKKPINDDMLSVFQRALDPLLVEDTHVLQSKSVDTQPFGCARAPSCIHIGDVMPTLVSLLPQGIEELLPRDDRTGHTHNNDDDDSCQCCTAVRCLIAFRVYEVEQIWSVLSHLRQCVDK